MDILKIHSRKMNLTRGINLKKIAEQMSGSSGAEAKVSTIFDFLLKLDSLINLFKSKVC